MFGLVILMATVIVSVEFEVCLRLKLKMVKLGSWS